MEPIQFDKFPITRYQGSKRKILPWIHHTIKDIKFQSVLDGFGGSGVVSYLLKKMEKHVTYNDNMYFNYIIGKAIIENKNVKFLPNDLVELNKSHGSVPYPGIISEIFKHVYYLNKENKWLDMITPNILHMNHYHPPELDFKRSVAFYALFQACLIKRPYNLFHRKNLNLRTAEVKRNFGNKTTWDRPFPFYVEKFIDEANSLIFDSGIDCRSLNKSIFDIDEYGYDLVYLDPPYVRKHIDSSSSYLNYYHFLEGLSKYYEWPELINFEKHHFPLKNSVYQNDFTNSNVKESFEKMLLKFQKSKIILSYKNGGNPSIQYIISLMKKVKRNTKTVSIHYKYALNKQNGNAKQNREVLIIGT